MTWKDIQSVSADIAERAVNLPRLLRGKYVAEKMELMLAPFSLGEARGIITDIIRDEVFNILRDMEDARAEAMLQEAIDDGFVSLP